MSAIIAVLGVPAPPAAPMASHEIAAIRCARCDYVDMFGGAIPFRPIPIAVGTLILLAVLMVLTVNDSARSRTCARWLIAVVVGGILAVTLIGGPAGTGAPNLYPGRTIHEQLTNVDHALGVFNVVGNLAMFVPLGWLLALVVRRRPLVVAAAVGFGLSLTIEVVQALIGRVADIDDVILNGSGAVLGAGIALLIRSTMDRFRAGRGLRDVTST